MDPCAASGRAGHWLGPFVTRQRLQPIRREGNQLVILDQRQLPNHEVTETLATLEDVIGAIQSLKVRGAPLIGITAAYGMALALSLAMHQNGRVALHLLDEGFQRLAAARPTAVNLSAVVKDGLARLSGKTDADLVESAWQWAEHVHQDDAEACQRIGSHAADWLRGKRHFVTICNTGVLATGGMGTALGAIYTLHDQGEAPRVFALETRPVLQGARLTAFELARAEIPVTLITDGMAAHVMATQPIDAVLVGADRIARDGSTANKIGTRNLAVVAQAAGVPVYVLAPETTVDRSMASGDSIPIEQRDPAELTASVGIDYGALKVSLANPAFDVTPPALIDAIITDKRVYSKVDGRIQL